MKIYLFLIFMVGVPLHTLTKVLTILEVLMEVSFLGLIPGRIVIKRES